MTSGTGRRLGIVAVLAVVLNNCGGGTPVQPSGPGAPATPGLSCGVERWAVKTLSDADAAGVHLNNVQATTIKQLNLIAGHCGGGPNRRTYTEEFQVYEVVGRIIVARLEDDRDYHVALADPDDAAYTIVTEVADPVCQGVVSSPHLGALTQARAGWDTLRAGKSLPSLAGTTVRVRGVGFFDFDHNQTGRSQSCIELHPVLAIQPVQ